MQAAEGRASERRKRAVNEFPRLPPYCRPSVGLRVPRASQTSFRAYLLSAFRILGDGWKGSRERKSTVGKKQKKGKSKKTRPRALLTPIYLHLQLATDKTISRLLLLFFNNIQRHLINRATQPILL